MSNLERFLRELRKTTRVVVLVNAVLTGILIVVFTTGAFTLPHHVQESSFDQTWLIDRSESKPIDEATVSRTILGKAVFRTNRKLEEKVVDELARFQFRGATSGVGEPKAFVKDLGRKKMITIRVGELLGGRFEVTAIERDGIHLRRGDEYFKLGR